MLTYYCRKKFLFMSALGAVSYCPPSPVKKSWFLRMG